MPPATTTLSQQSLDAALSSFVDALGADAVLTAAGRSAGVPGPLPVRDLGSWNDHAYRRFCETLEDALDPNGILAPGRHGIWPQSMRDGNGG